MRAVQSLRVHNSIALLVAAAASSSAQAPDEDDSREAVNEKAQAEKVSTLQPYVPTKAEQLITTLENRFFYSTTKWHPFFEDVYRGGGCRKGNVHERPDSPEDNHG